MYVKIFYFFDYVSFNSFFKGEYTILIKTITYSYNTRVVFILAIIGSTRLVSKEEVERRFSLILRFFTKLMKHSLNFLANSLSS